jgi:predicted nuclease of restriction endonuclease-like (RecB) superfamily
MNPLETHVESLLTELRQLVVHARARVAVSINSELVLLYWQIGQRLVQSGQVRAKYGEAVMQTIAKSLTAEFGQGFSKSVLSRAIRFFEICPDRQTIATLWQQLSWSHIRELLPLKNDLQRDFYLQMTILERWSVRNLRQRMDSMLFERTALSKQPQNVIEAELEKLKETKTITPDLIFKDPYILDFLGLQPDYSERQLEDAILNDLEKFLLEMGMGFTFVARQKRIAVGSEDYYLDLLLYHRDLQALVALELKLERFQAAHKGQMELYLRWLDKFERRENENAPIGLILCSQTDAEHIELLGLERDNIRVAEYLTRLPPFEVLQARLQLAIQHAVDRHLED